MTRQGIINTLYGRILLDNLNNVIKDYPMTIIVITCVLILIVFQLFLDESTWKSETHVSVALT